MFDLLRISLQAAVPLYAVELQRLPWSEVEAIARECGQVVAEKGDIIQFKSEKKGETAKAFNSLARGLAALSFAPCGVRFQGEHYEAVHPDAPKAPSDIPQRYAGYYLTAQRAGCDDLKIREQIVEMVREDAALDARMCVKCGASVERELDEHQSGPTNVSGLWFRYRCVSCRYFTSRVE